LSEDTARIVQQLETSEKIEKHYLNYSVSKAITSGIGGGASERQPSHRGVGVPPFVGVGDRARSSSQIRGDLARGIFRGALGYNVANL
jgi:hypothetical protein